MHFGGGDGPRPASLRRPDSRIRAGGRARRQCPRCPRAPWSGRRGAPRFLGRRRTAARPPIPAGPGYRRSTPPPSGRSSGATRSTPAAAASRPRPVGRRGGHRDAVLQRPDRHCDGVLRRTVLVGSRHGRVRPRPIRAPRPTADSPASWPCTRFTRIRTCPAFHGVHAAGPAAWASASVRAASRSRSATLLPARPPPRRWPGRQGRDAARSPPAAGDAAPARPPPRCRQRKTPKSDNHSGANSAPADAVVQAGALADVVQDRGEQQQVGAVHPANQPGGLDRGLHQMPVDGVAVDRVALRQRPQPVPAGQERGDHPGLVERLPDAVPAARRRRAARSAPAGRGPATARASARRS